MKIFNLFATIAALTASVTCAKVEISDWTYDNVVIGETYNIELTTDAHATQRVIQLALIQLSPNPNVLWKVIRNIEFDLYTKAPGTNVSWTVGENIPPGDGYGLWLISEKKGTDHPQHEDKTSWFTISAASNKERRAIEWSG